MMQIHFFNLWITVALEPIFFETKNISKHKTVNPIPIPSPTYYAHPKHCRTPKIFSFLRRHNRRMR